MLPGADKIIECPYCGSIMKEKTISSFHVLHTALYSDGKKILFPYNPEHPIVTKCPGCAEPFWVKDAKVLGKLSENVYTFNMRGEEIKNDDWENAPYLRFLTVSEYNDLLKSKLNESREDEFFIRRMIWWTYNDLIRKGKYEDISDKIYQIWRNNLKELKEFYDTTDDIQKIMKAEIHRNLGEFQQCLAMIREIDDEELRPVKLNYIKACFEEETELFELHPLDDRDVFRTLKTDNIEVVKKLFDEGVTIDFRAEPNALILHAMGDKGFRNLAELFIQMGADLNAGNDLQETPLHIVCKRKNRALAELFIQKGADVNAIDKKGETPLFRSLCENNKEIMELLISHGADVNVRNNEGETLLHKICRDVFRDAAPILLLHGADVNAQDGKGNTPLHNSCAEGLKEIANMLIEKGADVRARNKRGDTPLHRACVRGQKATVELLLKCGADINARNDNGETPKQGAERKGDQEVVELLSVNKAGNI